jgi:Fur family ferric uptake transcriptional regulator
MGTLESSQLTPPEAGLIQHALVSRSEGQLYEVAFEREHHDHLICTTCGQIVEYQSEAMETLQREIAKRFGSSSTITSKSCVGVVATAERPR